MQNIPMSMIYSISNDITVTDQDWTQSQKSNDMQYVAMSNKQVIGGYNGHSTTTGPIWIDNNLVNGQGWWGNGGSGVSGGNMCGCGCGSLNGCNGNYNFPNAPTTTGYSFVSTSLDESTIEFLELVLIAMGVSMTYQEFLNMSSTERKSLLRDIKIKQITK
jgi:hypothetical protein